MMDALWCYGLPDGIATPIDVRTVAAPVRTAIAASGEEASRCNVETLCCDLPVIFFFMNWHSDPFLHQRSCQSHVCMDVSYYTLSTRRCERENGPEEPTHRKRDILVVAQKSELSRLKPQ